MIQQPLKLNFNYSRFLATYCVIVQTLGCETTFVVNEDGIGVVAAYITMAHEF